MCDGLVLTTETAISFGNYRVRLYNNDCNGRGAKINDSLRPVSVNSSLGFAMLRANGFIVYYVCVCITV